MDVTDKYVVYVRERLRDGTEESAQVVTGLAAAVAHANRMRDGLNPHNVDCLVFKLGEHVPLREETVEVPQPSVKTARYVV